MILWVPVMLWVGAEWFPVTLPLAVPEPVVACIGDYTMPKTTSRGVLVNYECITEDNKIIKFSVTGEFNI